MRQWRPCGSTGWFCPKRGSGGGWAEALRGSEGSGDGERGGQTPCPASRGRDGGGGSGGPSPVCPRIGRLPATPADRRLEPTRRTLHRFVAIGALHDLKHTRARELPSRAITVQRATRGDKTVAARLLVNSLLGRIVRVALLVLAVGHQRLRSELVVGHDLPPIP